MQRADHAHPDRPALAGQRGDRGLGPLAQVPVGLVGGQERQLVHQHHHERELRGQREGAGPAAELPGPVVHLGDRGLQQLDHRGRVAGVPVEQGPAERQLHPLGIQRPHLHPPAAMAGSRARIIDQITEPFPDPVAPAISTCVDGQPQPPWRAVLAPADRQPGQVHLAGNRQGGDRIGEGVRADQLQQQHARRDVADPAQPGAERVRQVLGLGGEVGRGLPGDQADPHQVHRPGPVHPAEHRQHRLAPVVRREPGQGHRGLPPAPVEPPPPPVPHRHRDEPGEPRRLHDPQPGQARRQPAAARPAMPGQPSPSQVTTTSAAAASSERMGEREPQHPPDEPQQLDDEDHRFRGAVHRGPPHRGRERVAVVDLGELLAPHPVTAARH